MPKKKNKIHNNREDTNVVAVAATATTTRTLPLDRTTIPLSVSDPTRKHQQEVSLPSTQQPRQYRSAVALSTTANLQQHASDSTSMIQNNRIDDESNDNENDDEDRKPGSSSVPFTERERMIQPFNQQPEMNTTATRMTTTRSSSSSNPTSPTTLTEIARSLELERRYESLLLQYQIQQRIIQQQQPQPDLSSSLSSMFPSRTRCPHSLPFPLSPRPLLFPDDPLLQQRLQQQRQQQQHVIGISDYQIQQSMIQQQHPDLFVSLSSMFPSRNHPPLLPFPHYLSPLFPEDPLVQQLQQQQALMSSVLNQVIEPTNDPLFLARHQTLSGLVSSLDLQTELMLQQQQQQNQRQQQQNQRQQQQQHLRESFRVGTSSIGSQQSILFNPLHHRLVRSISNNSAQDQKEDDMRQMLTRQQQQQNNNERIIPRTGFDPQNTTVFLNRNINTTIHATTTMTSRTAITRKLPCLLGVMDDRDKLSPHQWLLRQHIEAFEATEEDVQTHTRGRNKPIVLHQVGIRCIHCKHRSVNQRWKGSTYFPAKLLGIYQAAQNMSTTHLQCGLCPDMPLTIKDQFAHTIGTKYITGAGRPYWAEAAQRLGLVDTEDGIVWQPSSSLSE
jgi:hypothetical protein